MFDSSMQHHVSHNQENNSNSMPTSGLESMGVPKNKAFSSLFARVKDETRECMKLLALSVYDSEVFLYAQDGQTQSIWPLNVESLELDRYPALSITHQDEEHMDEHAIPAIGKHISVLTYFKLAQVIQKLIESGEITLEELKPEIIFQRKEVREVLDV